MKGRRTGLAEPGSARKLMKKGAGKTQKSIQGEMNLPSLARCAVGWAKTKGSRGGMLIGPQRKEVANNEETMQ